MHKHGSVEHAPMAALHTLRGAVLEIEQPPKIKKLLWISEGTCMQQTSCMKLCQGSVHACASIMEKCIIILAQLVNYYIAYIIYISFIQ